MRINIQNAEKQLQRFLHTRQDMKSWRCIHAPISRFFDDEKAEELKSAKSLGLIADIFGKEDGHLFLCHDGDILILFKGRTHNIVSLFRDKLIDALKIRESSYKIHDMEREAILIQNVCAQKIKTLKALNPEKETPIRPLIVDDKLAQTIETRRRKQPSTALIIEDDKMMRMMLSTILKNAHISGHNLKIFEETNGFDGLESCFLQAPDIIFLDIEMPEHDGISVLNKITEHDPNAFVIMFSGNSSKNNIQEATDGGARGFVTKPFAQDRVYHYLSRCPSLRKKLEEQEQLKKSGSPLLNSPDD